MPIWNRVGPMNWIRFGGATYAMTLAYRQGAFAARDGRDEGANPYPATLEGSRAWLRGHTNECMGEHIRFGVDVIATSPRLNRTFELDQAVPRDSSGDVDMDWYARQLTALDAPVEAAVRLLPEGKQLTWRQYRAALKAEGFALTTEQIHDLVGRARQRVSRGHTALSAEETGVVEQLSSPKQTLLLAVAEISEEAPSRLVETWRVESRCDRRAGWAAAIGRQLEDAAFLIDFRRNGYCELTQKGWAAIPVLRHIEIEEHMAAVEEAEMAPPAPRF